MSVDIDNVNEDEDEDDFCDRVYLLPASRLSGPLRLCEKEQHP